MLHQPARVAALTETQGTDSFVLSGKPDDSFRSFADHYGTGTSPVVYSAFMEDHFEIAPGSFNGTDTITRGTPLFSSNGGSPVNFPAGTKTIIPWWPGGRPYHSFVSAMTAGTVLTLWDSFCVFSGSSPATVSLPALAQTPQGFSVTFRNSSGSHTLTLDPDASEQIEGATSWVVYPGQTVTIIRTPSSWAVLVEPARKQVIAAWGRFSSSGGAPAIADSHRVSSVTRSGAGQYSVTLSPAMPDANYAVIATCQRATNNFIVNVSASSITTNGFALVVTAADGTTLSDVGIVTFIVLGTGA